MGSIEIPCAVCSRPIVLRNSRWGRRWLHAMPDGSHLVLCTSANYLNPEWLASLGIDPGDRSLTAKPHEYDPTRVLAELQEMSQRQGEPNEHS